MQHIGFTGTAKGMTTAQRAAFCKLLFDLSILDSIAFHHGDCIGADADAHKLAIPYVAEIHIHPCNVECRRAFCTVPEGIRGVIAAPSAPLMRNLDIVENTELLIATPGEPSEVLRSGTWMTIRAARKQKSPLFLILPDGTVQNENV